MRIRLCLAVTAAALVPAAAAAGYGEPPLPATEISKPVSLRDAANRGMVKLTSKGGFGTDAVAVDLNWKPLPGPTRVTLRIDFTGAKNLDLARQTAAKAVPKGIAELNRLAARGGSPQVRFDVQYIVTGEGSPQQPGFHQITVNQKPGFRSFVRGGEPVNGTQGNTGEWAAEDLVDPAVFAHEALHLAGLPDRYDDYYVEAGTGRQFRVPDRGLNDQAQIDAWARAHVPPLRPGGNIIGKPMPGRGCDVMATTDAACRKLTKGDLKTLAGQAGVRLEAPAGDVLANKAGDQQNMGVGEPLNLFAPRNGKAHADGLVAYCINLSDHIPAQGVGFDVIGPASSLPGPGGQQLQAVLDHIATLPRAEGGKGERDGGQEAVWAVTNPSFAREGAAAAILAAVGLPPTGGAGVTDVSSANAASAGTGAVNADGTVAPALPEVPAPPAVPIRLERATLSREVLRAGRANRVELTLQITGGGPTVVLRVQRRAGARWRGVGNFPARKVGAGEVILGLNMPRLTAGEYRVKVTGPFPARTAAFSVR
ncbi:MAG: hypothetical protein U0237_01555 [Thermoleophilia bacterium]